MIPPRLCRLAGFEGPHKTPTPGGFTIKKEVPVVRVAGPDVAGLLAVMPAETTIAMASIARPHPSHT